MTKTVNIPIIGTTDGDKVRLYKKRKFTPVWRKSVGNEAWQKLSEEDVEWRKNKQKENE